VALGLATMSSSGSGVARMDHVIGGKFKLGKKIGSGSFGELYLGTPCGFFFLPPPCVLWCMHVGDRNGWIGFAGVNVQNGEEVAVKLVCGEQLS
jgi:hypothetical protein